MDAPAPPEDATAQAILKATLDVVAERGLRGATTRLIAARSGVNEVTLFRRFGSKAHLLRAALLAQAQALGERAVHHTGDLHADLVDLVRGYQDTLQCIGPVLGVLITEVPRHPEFAPVLDAPRALFRQVGTLLGHYQQAGQLRQEPLGTLLPALLGPLVLPHLIPELARALLTTAGEPLTPDAETHVRAFLRGRATPQEEPS